MWKKTKDETKQVRRPRGPRMVTVKTWKNKEGRSVSLITAPRRPQYTKVSDVRVKEGLKQFANRDDAIDYVKNYKKKFKGRK